MSYFLQLAVLTILPALAGRQLGRYPGRPVFPRGLALGLGAGLCALWFAAAWIGRAYADTDRPFSALAGWFAHSGKWWFLLVGAMFCHGLALGSRQIPATRLRRVVYYGALFIVLCLSGSRTVPVYLFLGEERRDEHGFLRQSKDHEWTCAPVAMVNYLERFRGMREVTEREASRACGTTLEGSTTTGLVQAFRRYGLTNATARVLGWDELARHGPPAIVSISTLPEVRHATLLVGIDGEVMNFIDPAYGRWSTSREHFLKIWYGRTVLPE